MELKQRSAPFIAQLIERGVLTLAAGPIVIRFLPPLVIGKSDIDNVLEAVTDVLIVQK